MTTLDVLSKGRAWLGIGAAWNIEEATGLGLPFPGTAERFERLEETLQICQQMWSDNEGPYEGGTTASAAPSTRPSPCASRRSSSAAAGEKKTLRLVAKYAQACNLFAGPELEHKLSVLRQHCEAEGRDYDDVEKTVMFHFDPGEKGEKVDQVIEQLRGMAALGVSEAHAASRGCGRRSGWSCRSGDHPGHRGVLRFAAGPPPRSVARWRGPFRRPGRRGVAPARREPRPIVGTRRQAYQLTKLEICQLSAVASAP